MRKGCFRMWMGSMMALLAAVIVGAASFRLGVLRSSGIT